MRIESYHPGVLFLYFTAMLVFTFWFQQPVFLILSLVGSMGVAGCLFRAQLWKRLGGALLAGIVVFLWSAVFCRFGETVLWEQFLGNPMTMEGLVYSVTIGVRVTAGLLWCSSLFRLVPVHQILGLLGRVMPHLSLYITILLRLIPRMGQHRRSIRSARACLGIAPGGRAALRTESMVLTWVLDSLGATHRSMTCRGYSLRRRTSYSNLLLGHGDRVLLTGQCWGLVILLCGWALNQTRAWYNPVLIINTITPLSTVFYGAYLLFALLPVELELLSVFRRRRDRRQIVWGLERRRAE